MTKPSSLRSRLIVAVATGFGLGNAPVASGTFGALLGVPLVLGFAALTLWWQVGVALLLTALAIPICDAAEGLLGGKKDDGRIVADEYLTLPIAVIGLPLLATFRQSPLNGLILLGTVFVLSRICDILKPFPARQIQRMKGGWGIVLDDFFASAYAMILSHGALDLLRSFVFPLTSRG